MKDMKTKLTDDRPVMEKSSVSHQELKDLAIYLEGMYKGQGNILPLGRVHIDNLWTAISPDCGTEPYKPHIFGCKYFDTKQFEPSASPVQPTCISCGVPNDLHGTCCGWENAKTPYDPATGLVTDTRHPHHGKPINDWFSGQRAFNVVNAAPASPVQEPDKSFERFFNEYNSRYLLGIKDLSSEGVRTRMYAAVREYTADLLREVATLREQVKELEKVYEDVCTDKAMLQAEVERLKKRFKNLSDYWRGRNHRFEADAIDRIINNTTEP